MTQYPPPPPQLPGGNGFPPPGPPRKNNLRVSLRSFFQKRHGVIIPGIVLGLISFSLSFTAIRPHLPYWLPVLAQPLSDRPVNEIGTEQNEDGARETFLAAMDAFRERDFERTCEFLSGDDRAASLLLAEGCPAAMKELASASSDEYLKIQTSCEIESVILSENNTKAVVTLRDCKGLDPKDRTSGLDYEQGRWVLGSSS